jgi:hypothetical protein
MFGGIRSTYAGNMKVEGAKMGGQRDIQLAQTLKWLLLGRTFCACGGLTVSMIISKVSNNAHDLDLPEVTT